MKTLKLTADEFLVLKKLMEEQFSKLMNMEEVLNSYERKEFKVLFKLKTKFIN